MHVGVLQRILSRLLWFTVGSLVVPMGVGLAYGDDKWWCFAIPAFLAALSAYAFARLPAARSTLLETMRRREGFVAVVLGWTVLVLFTAVAFQLTGSFASFGGAVFESMSGFTTTGASVISDIEGLPKSVLMARSFSHWIGGMGIIVLSVAVLPELAVGGMQLMNAESSGIDSDKLAPRIAATARRLWILYFGITLVQTLLLLLGNMNLFDAVNHAMATIATGGFSTKNNSVAGFDSVYIELVIVFFMFISGINFTLQYRALLMRQPQKLFGSPEVKLYTLITLLAILFIALDLYTTGTYDNPATAVRNSAFQTVSIMTTTGFGTADFSIWPSFSQLTLVALMMIGACAGSTAGGFKVVRLYVVIKHAIMQLHRLVRPNLIEVLTIGEREVPRETTESVLGFFWLYFAALLVGSLVMTALGLDLVSGTTASISAMNSIGPGLGSVGAASNFGGVPDAGLYVLSFQMLLGRLEIYTVIVLFTGHFWRRG